MPTPYDYTVAQPDANSYFDAVRRGRADRQAVEQEQQLGALRRYLPGALDGNEESRRMALQSAPVDQMASLKQMFMQMDAPKLAATKEFRAQTAAGAYMIKDPAQWAAFQEQRKAEAQRLGIPFGDVPFEQKDQLIAMGRTVDELINEEIERKKIALDESRTNAQNAASYASAAASKALASQRVTGGAVDPLPPSMQKNEDSDIEVLQGLQSANAQTDDFINQLSVGPKGEAPSLELGPINNAMAVGQNYLGASTPNSRGIANFDAFIEGLRNQILLLHKGVQTEGDAQRALNQILRNRNDQGVVLSRLKMLKMLNERAAKQRLQLINVRRARNGFPAFDPSQVALPDSGQAAPPNPVNVQPAASGTPANWVFDANGNLVADQ
jgi:hypothetical protein